jgi:hypothetical protein
MIRTIRFSSLAAVVAIAAGCAASSGSPPSISPTAERSLDGLYRVDNSVLQFAEAKLDLDLSGYDAFMLGPVAVTYQKEPGVRTGASGDGNIALTERQMTTLKEVYLEEIEKALTEDGGYRLVTTPGPNVLRLDAYLLDLVMRVDIEATVGRSRAFTTSYGEVSMILELHDSESGQVLARVAERRDPTRNPNGMVEISRTFVRADVTRMFRNWAQTLRERLDAVRAANLSGGGA